MNHVIDSFVGRVVPSVGEVRRYLLACPNGHTKVWDTNLERGEELPCEGEGCGAKYIWSYSLTQTEGDSKGSQKKDKEGLPLTEPLPLRKDDKGKPADSQRLG